MTWGALAEAVSRYGIQRQPAAADTRPNHLFTVDAVTDWFGIDSDMIPPTRSEAMSVPAMARARHIVTTPARLPIVITPADYPYRTLIDQPDPKRTRAAVLTDTLDDLLFLGMALWRVTERYAPQGRAKVGRPRHAERIDLGRTTYDEQAGRWLIDGQPVMDRDMIWFEGPHEGVLAFGGRAMRSAVRLDTAYRNSANNPAIVAELHQTSDDVMSDAEIQGLVSEARAAIAAHGVLYTSAGMELTTHSASPENLLISGRNAAAVDIARMVGLPASVLDAHAPGSSGTYQNVQARLREARDIGVDAYSTPITERLSMDDILPRGVSCVFHWDAMLREDFSDRMGGYKTAVEAGVYTAAECRAMEAGQPREAAP